MPLPEGQHATRLQRSRWPSAAASFGAPARPPCTQPDPWRPPCGCVCRCDTWLNPEDNTTVIGYVPRLYNITRPTIPGWVYTYAEPAPASSTPPAMPGGGRAGAAWVVACALAAALLL